MPLHFKGLTGRVHGNVQPVTGYRDGAQGSTISVGDSPSWPPMALALGTYSAPGGVFTHETHFRLQFRTLTFCICENVRRLGMRSLISLDPSSFFASMQFGRRLYGNGICFAKAIF